MQRVKTVFLTMILYSYCGLCAGQDVSDPCTPNPCYTATATCFVNYQGVAECSDPCSPNPCQLNTDQMRNCYVNSMGMQQCTPVKIQFEYTAADTVTERSVFTRRVCRDFTNPVTNEVSFSLSAYPESSDLSISNNLIIPANMRCVTASISIMDDSVPEDTETFQIYLKSTSVAVDENQNRLILNVMDSDSGSSDDMWDEQDQIPLANVIPNCGSKTTATVNQTTQPASSSTDILRGVCPTPTTTNSVESGCTSMYSGSSTCAFVCQDGFEALSGAMSRTCSRSRWSGSPLFCIQNIDECSLNSDNCSPQATCTNTVGSFTCTCSTGYSGDGVTCEDCTIPSVCMNGGTCFGGVCNCATGFIGTTCSLIDCTIPFVCMNGGTCVRVQGACNCATGFMGTRCSLIDCNFPGICGNGGMCSNGRCSCAPGYTGQRCYQDINECLLNPCVAGNTRACIDGVNSFTCQCNSGYQGILCEDYDECFSDPCSNGATCTSSGSSYTCECSPSWRGTRCTVDVDECLQIPSPCRFSSNTECHNTQGSFACLCKVGFVGSYSPALKAFYSPCTEDTTPPLVTCPSNVFKTVQFGTVDTVVSWPEPVAIDDSMSVSLDSQTHMPASFFSVGKTMVTYVFKDPANNTAECSFDVTVVEDCTALKTMQCDPGTCSCMDQSCDQVTGVCRNICTVLDCPADIESMSLSQVNPSLSVDITCTLRGSTTVLLELLVWLSTESNSLNVSRINPLTSSEIGSDDMSSGTFRVDNVTDEMNLYCVLLQENTLIGSVSVTNFVYELPSLTAAPASKDKSTTSVTISWRAWNTSTDKGNPPVDGYIPYYRQNSSDMWINGSFILTNETLEFEAGSLDVDTVYEFSVAAVREGENGEGPRSPSVTVKTLCNVPNQVASVKVQVTSSNRLNVSWQLPPGESMCSTGVTSFKVYYKEEGSSDDKLQLAGTVDDADQKWFLVDDQLLKPGTSYSFFVTVNTDQESDFLESNVIDAPTSIPLFAIIAAVAGIVLLMILLFLVTVVFIKRRKDTNNSTPAQRPGDNIYDNPVFGDPDEPRLDEVSAKPKPEKPKKPEKAVKPVLQPSVHDSEDRSIENLSIEQDDGIYGNLEPPQPIRVAEFGKYFKQNSDKFEQEFSILGGSKQEFDWKVAEDPANKKKNRFKNMYTYDHSRVVLKDMNDHDGTDYYNASFIKDTNDVTAYIASQAPNRASLDDFIRMIWEQHVTTVVMVANLYEDGKERCLQYWPETEGSRISFGTITVTWVRTTQCSDFVIRYLTFKRGKATREVQQLHFLTWPDKDTPDHGTALIEFARQSKLLHKGKKYPMLVHCSAGIGRTGTFICLSCMMDVLKEEEYIDVFAFVNKMRQNRISMVQTSKQYVFLYQCLNEYHLTHHTEMTARQMARLNVESHRDSLSEEFELLSELGHDHRKDNNKNSVGKERENIARNRVRNKVPSNRNRVFLMSPGQSNEGNYINASYVKSFQKKDAFITTQSPLPNTIEDFWRMVFDAKSPLVVMLNQLDPSDPTCVQYWPDRGTNEYGNMIVTSVAVERNSGYTQRTFEVSHVNSKDVLSVTHMQMEEWRPDLNLQDIAGLIRDIDVMQKREQFTQPIVIHCINGFERSGVLVTVKSEMERIAVTETVDVFSTVKKLRDRHEHMLNNKDEYFLCFHILKTYLASSSNNYENSDSLRRA